jgi:ferric-dicitrate binding protein FerR (iron transport regulator)
MGRKRRDEDKRSEHADERETTAASAENDEPAPRRRRGRKLALLLALAGAATYLVRRNQRKAELDEGIWHEAPEPASTSTGPTASATPGAPTPTA